MRFAKVTRRMAMGQIATGAADRLGQKHMAGKFSTAAFEIAEGAADVRMFDAAGEESAGLHHLMAGVVNGRRRVIYAANDAEFVGVFGRLGEDLGDLHPGDFGADGLEWPSHFGRGIRLRIERIQLARAADQKEHNAIYVRLGIGRGGAHRRSERQAEWRERPRVQEIAAGESIAKRNRFRSIKADHVRRPQVGLLSV